ncbi:MAG: nuclear transport factor 2 family protein [Woeseiaceae bacterium]
MKTKVALSSLVLGLILTPVAVFAGDVEDLSAILDNFLAHAGELAAHERFWADDLVYTSSRGTRTTKAEILATFDEPENKSRRADPEYWGEDVDIRVYGDTAVVAFRLVGKLPDGKGTQNYFNTGTFLKRDGVWKAVAWQATKIPPPE